MASVFLFCTWTYTDVSLGDKTSWCGWKCACVCVCVCTEENVARDFFIYFDLKFIATPASGAKCSLYPQQRENTSQSLGKDKREPCPTQKHDFPCQKCFTDICLLQFCCGEMSPLNPCFSVLFLHLTDYDKCVQGEQPS